MHTKFVSGATQKMYHIYIEDIWKSSRAQPQRFCYHMKALYLPSDARPPSVVRVLQSQTRVLSCESTISGPSQDYFTIKVCSAGKSDRRRDVTQGNPSRPFEWGFKIGYSPNIYGDFCTFSCFSLDTEDQILQ